MKLHRFSIAHLWALTALVGIFVFVNTHPIRPHDFWWHIAAGREFASTGRIPLNDAYSYTMPSAPYPAYQTYWLMEWTLYQLYRWGGAALVILSQSVIVTTAYALTLWLAQRLSGSWRIAAFAALFAAALGINDWNVRPQTIAFLLAPLFLNTIQAYRRHPKSWLLLIFPAGMLIWVNAHGSFPIGLLLIALWSADEAWEIIVSWRHSQEQQRKQVRRLFAPIGALSAAALACLLNPRGIGVVQYVATMTTDPVIQSLVTEWAAPAFDTLGGQLFLGGLLASAAVLALSPKRPTPSQLLAFLAFGALGLRTLRGSIWFGLAMAPILAEHVGKIGKSAQERIGKSANQHESTRDTTIPTPYSLLPTPQSKMQNTLNALLAGLLLLGAVASLPWFKALWPLPPEKAGLISAETPVAATEVLLHERPPGKLFHAMSFGSYLIWAAQPAYPVFVDPRIELYPADLWLDYLRLSAAASGWETQLEAYGIQTLMLSPQEQAGLLTAVRESGQWDEVYTDAVSVILVRKD